MKESKPLIPNFLDLIDEVYESEEKKSSLVAKPGYRHNPSSATMMGSDGSVVGACLRSLYYKATKQPVTDKRTFTSKLQGDFGNGIHDKLGAVLAKSDKIKISSEVGAKIIIDPLTQEISYRMDGLVSHKGEMGCLELKTMHSFALQKMVRAGGPKDKDVLQVLCYLGANPELRWASLVYVGRDNAYRAEYHIYRDPETQAMVIQGITPAKSERPIKDMTFEKIVARWKELERHVEKAELPQRDYKAVLTKEGKYTESRQKNSVTYETDYACKYCSWKTHCWTLPDAKDASYKID